MIYQLQTPVFPLKMKTIVIDHHATNVGYADINLVDTTAPAAAFVLFQLFTELGLEITHDIAINLFMGIYTDTGGFRYPLTDHQILSAGAELVRIAPDFTKALFILDNSQTKQSIYFRAIALSNIDTYFNDSIAITHVSYEEMQDKGITMEDIGGDSISNVLKSVVSGIS